MYCKRKGLIILFFLNYELKVSSYSYLSCYERYDSLVFQ